MRQPISRILAAALALAALAGPAFAGVVEEKNKAIARKVLEEVLGQGKIEENESIYSPGFVVHNETRDAGREEDRAATRGWRQAFPDLKITVDKIIAEGDLVAVRFFAEGTNTGTGNGIPATGKSIHLSAVSIFRIVDGKVTDEWTAFDSLRLIQQLGLPVPDPR
ncbi:MAG TPA: ester cyclase [Thermoanaerobaculia bacterium]|nr:ester cyclase [Thermoanaerobaculia bacterium]